MLTHLKNQRKNKMTDEWGIFEKILLTPNDEPVELITIKTLHLLYVHPITLIIIIPNAIHMINSEQYPSFKSNITCCDKLKLKLIYTNF